MKLQPRKKIDLNNPDSYVTCAVCGDHMAALFVHIKQHGLNGETYLRKYGGKLRCKTLSEQHAESMKAMLAVPENRARWKQIQDDNFSKMTTEQIKAKWGKSGFLHPMWGRKQTAESIEQNRLANVQASARIKQERMADGTWDDYIETRVNRGSDNGMYGRTPPKGSGRCHYIEYTSEVSGVSYWLQGSYEVRFAKILDKLKVRWEKNHDRFCYTYNEVDRTYCPDFRVERHGFVRYYETKGYADEQALAKFKLMEDLKIPFFVVNKERLKAYERHLGI